MCSERLTGARPDPELTPDLEALLRRGSLWRAGEARLEAGRAIATGFPPLDDALPGGGWPRGAVVEILHGPCGIGELRLLLPALSALSREGRLVVYVAPPHRLCVPALKAHGVSPSRLLVVDVGSGSDALWAAEQALRSGACGAVLSWLRGWDAGTRALRRLQLAAETGDSLGVIFRGPGAAGQASPAALRLLLHPDTGGDGPGPGLELLKVRGGRRRRIALAQLGSPMGPAG